MIVAAFGADQLSVKRRVDQLRAEVDDGIGMGAANINLIEGRTAKPEDILGPARAAPFLGPRRLVIVDGLIDRFESQPGDRRTRGVDAMEALFQGMEAGLPETTILAFTGGAADPKRNAFVARLGRVDGAVVEHYPELKKDALPRFIREEAAARGMKLDGPAVQALADVTGSNTLALANEIEKLSLYTMGRPVTSDDVAAVCSGDRQARLFEFTDGVLDGDLGKAMGALPALYRSGETPEGLMAMMLVELRRMAVVADLVSAGVPPSEIGAKARIPQDWMVRRAVERVNRLGPEGVRQAFALVVEADRANKTGLMENETALEVMAARVCRLGRRPTSAGRGPTASGRGAR